MNKELYRIEEILKKYVDIKKLKITFITTFIVGMIAHGYVFLNAMYCHDSVVYGVPTDVIGGIISGTARTTPFSFIWYIFLTECKTTWLSGIVILLCYSFSSYFVCEVLKMDNIILTSMVSGIMVVSPTTIAANTYTVDCGNAFTLLFSSMAAFLFFKKSVLAKTLFFVAIVIAVGSYGPFISVFFSVVLIRVFIDYYQNLEVSAYIRKIIYIVFSCALAIGIIVLFSLVVGQIGNVDLQPRVNGVISSSATNQKSNNSSLIGVIYSSILVYGGKIFTNLLSTILFFCPKGLAYRLGIELPANSFFVENRILLCSFYLVCLLCFVAIIKASINRRKKSILIVFCVTTILLFLAMDIYGAITWSHLLMRYAYISPWLLMLSVANVFDYSQDSKCKIEKVYVNAACLLGIVTIVSGIYLANEVYAKEEAVYKSGLLLANRVADHVEAVDGYIPGETKVYFVGNLREYYAPVRNEFNFVRDFTGVGSPYWDTAIPLYWSFTGFLNSQVGIDVNYAVNPPFDYTYDAEGYADILISAGYVIDKEQFVENFEITNSFPNQNCYFWCEDILVFKLSKGLNEK